MESKSESIKKYGLREATADQMIESVGDEKIGRKIMVVGGDVLTSTVGKDFKNKFFDALEKTGEKQPNMRLINVGVAEADAIGTAVGLALSGKIPVVSLFAVFGTGRGFDQIKQHLAQAMANVKLIYTHRGLVGPDGKTHHAVEDLGLMLTLHNINVIVPADDVEAKSALEWALKHEGPYYIGLHREKFPRVHSEDYKFALGKASVLHEGKDAAIIAIGSMVWKALQAAKELEKENGLHVQVINMSSLKPIDEKAIKKAAATGKIITVEEHNEHGGLFSAVSGIIVRKHPGVKVEPIALTDYAPSGQYEQLCDKYGLNVENIKKQVLKLF